MGELDEWRRRRVCVTADLTVEAVEDLLAIPQGAVADAQHVLAASEQVGNKFVDGANRWLSHLLEPAGHLADIA